MSKHIPYTSEDCDVCGIHGSYDFEGEYLCERCYRVEIDNVQYEEEFNDETYQTLKQIDKNEYLYDN